MSLNFILTKNGDGLRIENITSIIITECGNKRIESFLVEERLKSWGIGIKLDKRLWKHGNK